ncbi:eukaryotic type KH-domain (KH-domain type I) [Xylaria digitata]|nr:eukaryotic type KH-domain (KH-domain type I) [Xylaria digitata]
MPLTKKGSRWVSDVVSKLIGLPTAITAPLTSEKIEAYALHVRIEEITQKLRIDDIVPANRNRRSPSPEPQCDASGKRTNTRQNRYRQRLEEERHSLIDTAMSTIPGYRAPSGYVPRREPGAMMKEKIYIPVKEFPEINFIGQLLGPRGRSLAEVNTESGAKIDIRGKGSIKEGRGRYRAKANGRFESDSYQDYEPLHCLITADTQDKIRKAKCLVQGVIEAIITTPEHANFRKCQQLRDFAIVNGTFRDDESRAVGNKDGEEKRIAVGIKCNICGGGGHVSLDYSKRKVPPWRRNTQFGQGKDKLEIEYQQLFSEISVQSYG